MDRPDAVPTGVWDKLTPAEREFIVMHEHRHALMRAKLGLTHAEYTALAEAVIKGEDK